MKLIEKLADEYFKKNHDDLALPVPAELADLSERFYNLADHVSKLSYQAGFEKALELVHAELNPKRLQYDDQDSIIDVLDAIRGEIVFLGEEEV